MCGSRPPGYCLRYRQSDRRFTRGVGFVSLSSCRNRSHHRADRHCRFWQRRPGELPHCSACAEVHERVHFRRSRASRSERHRRILPSLQAAGRQGAGGGPAVRATARGRARRHGHGHDVGVFDGLHHRNPPDHFRVEHGIGGVHGFVRVHSDCRLRGEPRRNLRRPVGGQGGRRGAVPTDGPQAPGAVRAGRSGKHGGELAPVPPAGEADAQDQAVWLRVFRGRALRVPVAASKPDPEGAELDDFARGHSRAVRTEWRREINGDAANPAVLRPEPVRARPVQERPAIEQIPAAREVGRSGVRDVAG
mmetsp:Transcript_3765/g.9129  ORF Transcript_3765/g.9129 Transcript_3765/m.9129 type:complete len:306 (-) Transcript_3765:1405-2322(-)